MNNDKVSNGSVSLPPVIEPVLQEVRLLADKVVGGSVRLRGEVVFVDEQTAMQWIAAQEAEAVVEPSATVSVDVAPTVEQVDIPSAFIEEPTPVRKKRGE